MVEPIKFEPADDAELSATRTEIEHRWGSSVGATTIPTLVLGRIIARLDAAEKARDASILARVEMIFKCGELEDQLEFSMMEMSDDD